MPPHPTLVHIRCSLTWCITPSLTLGAPGVFTCQSELQYWRAPSGPSLQPSYVQAQPMKAHVTGLTADLHLGQLALSCSRLKQARPCTQLPPQCQ